MENRKLNHLLMDEKEKNHEAILKTSNDLSVKIKEVLSKQYGRSVGEIKVENQPKTASIANQFIINQDTSIGFVVSERGIQFYFQGRVLAEEVNLEISAPLIAVRNRYFELIKVDKKHSFTEVSSHFTISRKQLGNRDFVEYAAFLLDNAYRLVLEIIENNKESITEMAA